MQNGIWVLLNSLENLQKPYCDEIKRAIQLAKEEKTEEEFYPKFYQERALEVLKQCEE